MSLRSTRHLTSVFLVREGSVLLLYRHGSRAIADSWVGIGGHLEPHELTDPTAAALRELEEEVGVTADQLTDLALRYVAVRDTGDEVRTTYYFTANLTVPGPTECTEGDLRWFDLTMDPATLDMPPTARIAFAHWLAGGRLDEQLRFIMVDADGRETGPF
ncbi:NUDIX domain-containing protein [Kribbella speibonae]|uniref:NUDIX domain-containing protein n=1 Tax=Kribbella speibonae TaxID=1572660 RepID=A0ABY2AA85_9ACTN|nr:NUDIX domain-containing protein [Kribbella speibonae]TCC25126.1 NUDIX domain-containing protein [Kribbella speibonae]